MNVTAARGVATARIRFAGSRRLAPWLVAASVWVALAGCGAPRGHGSAVPHTALAAPAADSQPAVLAPEAASGYSAKPGWWFARQAVAAAHPLATRAGLDILRAGGSALDAAVAVQAVLTLVEPQSSGIGGGAFLLHWNGRSLEAHDGRETAPVAADERLFLRPDGRPMTFAEAVVGGRAVGTPGVLRMLHAAHARHGRLPWPRLFEPAIRLAREGFEVGARLHAMLAADAALRADVHAARLYYDAAGRPWPVGARLRNPALADVLQAIAERGPDAFYRGSVAADIVRTVRGHPRHPGLLSDVDLAGYQPRQREPLCTDWRRYRICGFPPPSSGHLAIMQMLGMLEVLPEAGPPLVDGLPAPELLHRYAQAAQLAFADRAAYVADPDFVAAPAGRWDSLLGSPYLRTRAQRIGPRAGQRAEPGNPARPGMAAEAAMMPAQPEHGTSHISIVDGYGHAVAMTTSIEAQFGARLMVQGFLLNNQLTDFSFASVDAAGRPIANRVQPGKRPRSSMSPTLVFDRTSGQLLMSAGSPGGALIIHYTARTLLATLGWGLSPQAAIDLPHFGSTGGPLLLERGRYPRATLDALQARGHRVSEIEMTSGLQVLQRGRGGWLGGADPRREGIVAGD